MAGKSSSLAEVVTPPPVENHVAEIASRQKTSHDRLPRSSQQAGGYDDNAIHEYAGLDELAAPSPVQNPGEGRSRHLNPPEDARSRQTQDQLDRRALSMQQEGRDSLTQEEKGKPDDYENLDELAAPSPIENVHERHAYRHQDLEEVRSEQQQQRSKSHEEQINRPGTKQSGLTIKSRHAPYLTRLYVTSYLVFFSILGTLARLGIQTLTTYPGAPVTIVQLWANFAGCLLMGYLSEDRLLFRQEWALAQKKAREAAGSGTDGPNYSSDDAMKAMKKEYGTVKKTVPLYIGLAVGFCGSLTSFSSFMRDAFLALSNNLVTFEYNESGAEVGRTYSRNPGDSVMAVLAVLLLVICLCISALQMGAQIAIGLEPVLSSLPAINFRRWVDPAVIVLAWLSWIGAIIMTIWPPDRPGGPAAPDGSTWAQETWRGQALFAILFAPIGCLTRFHISLKLNGLISRFPLGTFMVNVFGTLILGMSWDLQRAPLAMAAIGGGRIGCQVLQGIQDGFCGCLTTVSTWILELTGLRREHAYFYGMMSVGVGLSTLVIVVGSLIWTDGILTVACVT